MGKIFVSYLRRDKSRVAGLVKELTDLGADIWWDEDSLAVGDRWRDNIELTIRECEYFIACFSRALPRWHTSTMEKEVRIAARLWRGRAAGDSKWILPVKLEDCSIPKILLDDSKTLEDLHWIRLDGENWGTGIRSIADIVLQRPREQARQELRKIAEEAARARGYASYARASAGLNEQAKLEAVRSEETAKQRQNEYFSSLSAYTAKYKDYGFANEIKTDHIDKEVADQHKNAFIFAICVFMPGALLIAWIVTVIGDWISDWISRLFHLIF